MKVTILGCGSAGGVPSLSRGWGNCDPNNPRNRRLRPSVLVERGDSCLLVDTSPDCRQQLLTADIHRLDAVLYTHDHADHLHGIDDLREINRAMKAELPIYAAADTLALIRQRFSYVMGTVEEGMSIYKPMLSPRTIEGPFSVGSIPVVPFEQDHGWCTTLGFRFGPIAYSTDVVNLPDDAFVALQGVKVWIVGCLCYHPHHTHAHLDKVVEWVERVKPEQTYLTHMPPILDYDTLCGKLPPHIRPAHDGLVVTVED